jgi:hypothetical protein
VPFAFSTNPPTPHAKKSTSGKAPPRTKVRRNNFARRYQALADSICTLRRLFLTVQTSRKDAMKDQEMAEPSASTPRRARSASAPIHVAETPVQIKNIAFRQGDATPGSLRRSVKRSSVKGSGRRGSSIGGGFEGESCLQSDQSLERAIRKG